MSSAALQSIEQQLPLLSHEEQICLIAKLAHRLRRQPPPPDFETDLIAMANDPEIQREIREIEAEFAGTEMDGLEGL